MDLFADNERVASLEAAVSSSQGLARLEGLVELAWQLRQRDCNRVLGIMAEAERLFDVLPAHEPSRASILARLMLIRGEMDWLATRLEGAQEHAEMAMGLFAGRNDPIGIGDAQWLLSFIWQDRGNKPQSQSCLNAAVKSYQMGGDRARVAMALARRLHLMAFSDIEGTRDGIRDLLEAPGEPPLMAKAWISSAQGVLAVSTGYPNACIKSFLRAHHAAMETGQILLAILSATNAADEFSGLGDLDAALEWDEIALELARGTGQPAMMGNPLMQIGNVLRMLGRTTEAEAALEEAVSTMAGIKHSSRYVITLIYHGELSLDQDQPEQALADFDLAQKRSEALGEVLLELSCRRGYASALCRLDRALEALPILDSALVLAERLGNVEERIKILWIYAQLHQQYDLPAPPDMTEGSAALHYFVRARRIAEDIPGYTPPAQLLDEISQAYAACGNYEQAFRCAMIATEARKNSHYEEASNRAMAMQIRREIEQARMETDHHRELAETERKRSHTLQESMAVLEALGSIGRRITASLDLDTSLESIYERINEVVDAPSLGIAVIDEQKDCLDYRLVLIQGQHQAPFTTPIETTSLSGWCIQHRSPILIGDVSTEYSRYVKELPGSIYSDSERSMIFMPLLFGEKILGLLTVQSPKIEAYDRRALEIVRAISAYLAIAMENARLFQRSVQSEQSLRREHEALLRTQAELKQLRGYIPICSACKNIRDDRGAWHQLETYIHNHTDIEFTHGICPECTKKLYGDLMK